MRMGMWSSSATKRIKFVEASFFPSSFFALFFHKTREEENEAREKEGRRRVNATDERLCFFSVHESAGKAMRMQSARRDAADSRRIPGIE
jgi:hypothetical protein